MKRPILSFKNDLLDLTIKCDRADGRLSRYLKRINKTADDEESRVEYRVNQKGTLKLFDVGTSDLVEVSERDNGIYEELPVFFESDYFVYAKFGKDVRDVRVKHSLESVTKSFDFESDGKILFGQLDFINSPGRFDLEFEILCGAEKREFSLRLMVVSEKMDVKRDYKKILERINQDHAKIVFAFLSKTLGSAGYADGDGSDGDRVRYRIFDKVFSYYKKACEKIVNNPHVKYVDKVYYKKADRIRHWTPQMVNCFARLDKSRQRCEYFRTEITEPEFDSIENKFVLYTLRDLSDLLKRVHKTLKANDLVGEGFLEYINEQKKALDDLAENPFFRHVGVFKGFRQHSLVMQKRQGYAEVCEAWRLLSKSLDPGGVDVDIGYKSIATLYEFWCFLEIFDLLKEKGYVAGEAMASGSLKEFWGELENDENSVTAIKYEFEDVKRSRKIVLSYQKNYGVKDGEETFAYLNSQRPDIVLSVVDSDGATFSYLFDAKYRISVKDDIDASPREAIDDMHRYRDAILYRAQKENLKHEIVGAYVLYPGRKDNAFDYDRFIQSENIGAIALLPSENEKLKEFLDVILSRDGVEAHLNRAIAPREATIRFGEEEKNVLIVRESRKGEKFEKSKNMKLLLSIPLGDGGEVPKSVDYVFEIVNDFAVELYKVVRRKIDKTNLLHELETEHKLDAKPFADEKAYPDGKFISFGEAMALME